MVTARPGSPPSANPRRSRADRPPCIAQTNFWDKRLNLRAAPNPLAPFGRIERGVQTIPEQINQARAAFAEAPDERARMGRISGFLWMAAAVVGAVDVFLP